MADPEVLHDFNPIGPADEEATGFKPVGEVGADFKPTQKAKPDVGSLESFGRGAANAFALGYSPQLIAAIESGHMPGSNDPEYLNELAKQKSSNEEAWNQHPWLYGTGMAAAAIPAAANAVLAGPEEAAAAGGAGLLAESGNIGSLAGAGLRSLTGGAGLAGEAASVLENPLAQGAVYGSSEGDTLGDKVSGAIAGAAGAKVAPMLLGAAGKGIGALGAKIAPEFSDQVSQALNNGISKGHIAGAIGDDVGFSVPAFVASDSNPSAFASNLDLRSSMANASNKTVNEIGGKLADIAGDANTNDTGEAIRNTIGNWAKDDQSPHGFESALNNAFKPVEEFRSNPARFNMTNMQAAADAVRNSSMAAISDVEPTLAIIAKAESVPNGLSFEDMHNLRRFIAKGIDFNRGPSGQNLDESILKRLYGSVTEDMRGAAGSLGGEEGTAAFNAANADAADLYKLRSSVLRITGNPDVNGARAKTGDQIYKGIESAALKNTSGPNFTDAANLQNVLSKYDPSTWDKVGQTYVAKNIAPNGNFSFNNLSRKYGTDLHPQGKSLLFGGGASNDLRQTLNKVETFGNLPSGNNVVGNHIDELAKKSSGGLGNKKGLLGELGAGAAESLILGGLPIKTLGTAGAASVLGNLSARNIAKPLSKYTPTTGQKIVGQALQKSAPLIGAQAINPLGAGAVKAGGQYAIMKGLQQVPPYLFSSGQASGGRIGRKSGGRTTGAAKAKADQLIAMVDRIKKDEGKGTKPLLNVDDTTIAKALEIANRGI